MKRINYIVDLIDKCDRIIDVGCDHCYLAIELLKQKKVDFVVNVDINKKPLEAGIKNLSLHNVVNKTQNIVNDGLKNINHKLQFQTFDYIIIAGMGSNTIIDILKYNKLQIKKYILQTNRNEYVLRKWLLTNGYSIIEERIVFDRNIYYPIIVVVKKQNWKLYSNLELKFGKLSMVKEPRIYYNYLIANLEFAKKQKQQNKYLEIKENNQIKLLNRIIKKYESKWNL